MSQKRMPSDQEIASLADRLRDLWQPGEEIRPWLREQGGVLLELIHGKWSWASMARVLTAAGITYRTGRPWSANLLRKDFSRAQAPLKGYARRPSSTAPDIVVLLPGSALPSTAMTQHATDAPPSITPGQRFKPAVPKPYAPPSELTADERTEIDANRKRILGY